jgi:hypothetical protein
VIVAEHEFTGFVSGRGQMNTIVDFVENHKELLTLFLGTIGGGFALWRWTVDQKWRRVQHAQSLVKEFLAKDTTKLAFEILDVTDEPVDFKTEKIEITDTFLIGALSTFDQKNKNDPQELIVRTVLDAFFEDLSIFQSHIDARLIKLRDIKPYLEYYILELVGQGRCHNSPEFGKQVAEYLTYFRYGRVITMAKNMRHPFPDVKQTKRH